ncbi:glutathione S-transferase family protein [Fodinicurvata sediminis]|uniref:glutathione S-transferase family protein n=1 Tax=Fodinicurvata sediminis TaxID=1121832 RepID=UPI0003B51697|nr:glutathione S-transferase family protein [Fodinicurvata sediminis]
MIRLLGRQTSGNVQKVIFLLEELGIEYEREDYGGEFGKLQTPEYLALNPNAKVPTLIDGKTVIWESNTILRYLAATHNPELNGSSPAQAAEVERWMDWLLASVNPHYMAAFQESKKPEQERNSAAFASAVSQIDGLLVLAEAHMEGKNYFALNRLTLADMALGPILKRCLEFPGERKPVPNLERWVDTLKQRDAFQVMLGNKASVLDKKR